MRALVLSAGLVASTFAAVPVAASCSAADPSSLQSAFPGLGVSAAAALGPALTDVAALRNAETRNRSASGARNRRIEQLHQQVANYDARKARSRPPVNFRNGQTLLRSLMQGGMPDPAYIANARAELKAAERDNAAGSTDDDGKLAAAADVRLAAAIERVTGDVSADGSFHALVDADRLMRERVADCAVWRSSSGVGLPRSLEALDRQDKALKGAIGSAAVGIAPKARAEIAAANDSATLQQLRLSYMGTPAASSAMERVGIAQALASRQTSVASVEHNLATASQAKRDAEAAAITRARAAQQSRADAEDKALLARQRAASVGTTTRNSGAAPVSGEPTEVQMRQALQSRLDGAQQGMAERKAQCKAGRGTGNPIEAMQCLALLGPEATGVAMPHVSITQFEKLNCGAATTGGYLCDYIIALDAGQFSSLTEAQTATKRFVNTSSRGWMVLDR